MNILIDTCTLLWWWSAPDRLSPRVLSLLRDRANLVAVSAASAWEVATKTRIGKLPDGGRIMAEWGQRIREDGFGELPMSRTHAIRAGSIPGEHPDPFDRMIAAQSILEELPVATPDPQIEGLGAEVLW